MKWKQKFLSNMFLRNALADFGERSTNSKIPGDFIPYFQYRIGRYQPDLLLYFPKEPYSVRYKNEIFNKLNEYNGYDIIKFLEFHFSQYPDKTDFIRFLYYEIQERLKPEKARKSFFLKLQTSFNWVAEKNQELKKTQEEKLRLEIEQGLKTIIQNQSVNSPLQVDRQNKALSDQLSSHFDKLMSETEKGIRDLTGSFITGNIQLNNRNHEDKIIQLLILTGQVQAPTQLAKGEQLFKKFTAADIATILHYHFDAFRDNKINTLQKKVGEQSERIKPGHPKVKKLSEALQEFFY
jgi:hypothetical protein